MIIFKYIPQATHVAVTVEDQGRLVTKQIPYTDVVDFFGAQKISRKDTGYLGTNLIREVVVEDKIKRLFHYPELTVTLNFAGRDVDTIHSNLIPNTHFKVMQVGNRRALSFPTFKFKNILGMLVLNNNATKNFISYNVCFAEMTGLSLNVNDNTTYYRSLLHNHFSDHICWPNELKDTANAVLNANSPAEQAGFVRLYLTSLFNTDLDPSARVREETVNNDPGFKEFLTTVFKPEFLANSHYVNYLEMVYIYLYYQFNVAASPSPNYIRAICSNSSNQVGRFFR